MKSAMTPTTRKQRLYRVLALWGGVLLLGMAYGLFCVKTGLGIPCVLHQVTGLECPGCGISRAILALARLDFAAAFGYNAIWPLILGYLLWVAAAGSLAYVKRGEFGYLPGKTWMHAVILGAVVAYGILRNFL